MPDSNARIDALAREFIDRLKVIARDELLALLGTESSASSVARKGTRLAAETQRAPSGKRAPAALKELQNKVQELIASQPGLRVEQMNASLGVKSGELALPIKKLLAAKVITTKGSRRATKYFPVAATNRRRKGSAKAK